MPVVGSAGLTHVELIGSVPSPKTRRGGFFFDSVATQGVCLPVFTICMAEAMRPETSLMLPGTISVVLAS